MGFWHRHKYWKTNYDLSGSVLTEKEKGMEIKVNITGGQITSFLTVICVLVFVIPVLWFIGEATFSHGGESGAGYLLMAISYWFAYTPYLLLLPVIGLARDMYHWKDRATQGQGFLELVNGTAAGLALYIAVFIGSLFWSVFIR